MNNNKGLINTIEWFKQAIPNPTKEQKCIQIGCHLEEVAEMMDSLGCVSFAKQINVYANSFKSCNSMPMRVIDKADTVALLDSLADQTVTAAGVSHMFGFNHIGALDEVNRSNFSKFEDGLPVFNEQGKIKKGKFYTAPDLSDFINGEHDER